MDKDRLLRNQKWKVENKELISLVKPTAVNEPLFKRMGQEYVVKVEEHNLELKQKQIENRQKNYQPILRQEVDAFSMKVDKIVQYLTKKR